ncbi:MAG: trypsin-like peptidase domain-containing protein [Pseudonocardia sp.]
MIPAGLDRDRVAELIVDGGRGPGSRVGELVVGARRGSGYRVGADTVLTAAHVVDGATAVRVRFRSDLPGAWEAAGAVRWSDPATDLAVVAIRPVSPAAGPPARFGAIGDRAAVLEVHAVGFPGWKLRAEDGSGPRPDLPGSRYRDSFHLSGSAPVLSNWREGTLEVVTTPPAAGEPGVSPWGGMSGAAVWVGDRIVGVVARHHPGDGPGRLAAVRLDRALDRLDPARHTELRTLLELPDVLPDVTPAAADDLVLSAYRAQLADIAPTELTGRATELAELLRFCGGGQPYAWWQADPYAGKTALSSWFALHPPAGVDVVCFFITSRLAGQSDSDAFLAAVIEQLAALVGEHAGTAPGAAARGGQMLRLLATAAQRCRESGRRLLLVVDGLDEDSGAVSGRPSIAALLPKRPPPGLHVLVTSRPLPELPDDVPTDHPLRTLRARLLDTQAEARERQHLARAELARLVRGSALQYELVALLAAAGGGGLTRTDLAELTGRPPPEVAAALAAGSGRTISARPPSATAGGLVEHGYLFAHETLRTSAEEAVGAALPGYGSRLHAWADGYRRAGWPGTTPDYLLRGYPRLLAATGAGAGLLELAVDRARQDRMRERTGGDALALAENEAATAQMLREDPPDLVALTRLAVGRHALEQRNAGLPQELPALWLRLGEPARALALASGLPDGSRVRARALIGMGRVAGETGDAAAADRFLADAGRAVAAVEEWPSDSEEMTTELVAAVAATGDLARARDLADAMMAPLLANLTPFGRSLHLTAVLAAAGDLDAAEAAARALPDPDLLVDRLVDIIGAAVIAGDGGRAARLVDEVTRLVDDGAGDAAIRARVLSRIAAHLAAGADHATALRFAATAEAQAAALPEPADRTRILVDVAAAVEDAGDRDQAGRLLRRAEAAASEIGDGGWFDPRVDLAARWERIGESGRADAVLATVSEVLDNRAITLRAMARAAAQRGAPGRADALVAAIDDAPRRVGALGDLAAAAAGADPARARRLALQVEREAVAHRDPRLHADLLVDVARAAADAGEPGRALQLITVAEQEVRLIGDPGTVERVLERLAEIAVLAGAPDTAHRITTGIASGDSRVAALTSVAVAGAGTGDHGVARWFRARAADEAVRVDGYYRASLLLRLARAAADAGDVAEAHRWAVAAERHALTAAEIEYTTPYLIDLAGLALDHGDPETARRLAATSQERVPRLPDVELQAIILLDLARLARRRRRPDRAAELLRDAQPLARPSTGPTIRWYKDPLVEWVAVAAELHGIHPAEEIAERELAGPRLDSARSALARVALDAGEPDEAERLGHRIGDADRRAAAFVDLVRRATDRIRRRRLAGAAEQAARAIELAGSRGRRLAGLATALSSGAGGAPPSAGGAPPSTAGAPWPEGDLVRRLAVDVLCSPAWRDALGPLARIEPGAVRAACDMVLIEG